MCYAVTPANDTIDILEIEDHEDIWSQGVYYFQKPKKIPAGSIIYGEAEYNNTTSNYNNPYFPPQDITAGMGDTAEQMLFSFSYLSYQTNDENIITDTVVHQRHYLNCNPKNTVGIVETNLENKFLIYPNPVSDFFTIDFQNQIQSVEVKVLNLLGETVLFQRISNSNSAILNSGLLPNGLYFIQINFNNQTLTKKIVKQ
jgi:hypothetical protein